MNHILKSMIFLLIFFLLQLQAYQIDILRDLVRSNFQTSALKKQELAQAEKKQGLFSIILEKLTPEKIQKHIQSIKDIKERDSLSQQDQAELVVSLFDTNKKIENTVLNDPLVRALELVKGEKNPESNFYAIFCKLAQPKTISGKVTLGSFLLNPTKKIKILKQRQSIITSIPKLPIKKELKDLARIESSLYELLFGKLIDSELETKTVYSQTPLLSSLINKNPSIYNISTLFSAITPYIKLLFGGIYIPVMQTNHVALFLLNNQNLHPSTLSQPLLSQKNIESLYNTITSGSFFDNSTFEERINSFAALQNNLLLTYAKKQIEKRLTFLDFASLFGKQYMLFHRASHGYFTAFLALLTVIPSLWNLASNATILTFIGNKAKKIQQYLIDIATYVSLCEKLADEMQKIPELQDSSFARYFAEFNDNQNLNYLRSLLKKSTFKTSASTWCNWGNIFVTLQELEKHKNDFIPLIKGVGEIDMYYGIAHLMQKQNTHGTRFCFAKYIQNTTPEIHATDFWNPFVLTHKKQADIITNTIHLGNNESKNVVITGPNTCGKTTIILALMYNAILAQTFGIAAASEFTCTPFGKMNAILTISTNGAVGDSRFRAEIRQAKQLLQSVSEAKENGELVFTIQDEIFTGTNHQDGSYAASNFLKKLGLYENNITLLATHYLELTELGEPYENYKIDADVTPADTIIRHFTISKGISNVNVAHIIAREAGLS